MAWQDYLPNFNFSNFGTVITLFIIAIIIIIFVGVGAFLLIRHLRFNKQVVILEDVSGSDDLEPIGKDKAMLIKVGKGGLELLYLRKRKLFRLAYGKRMGKNRYYFAIGPDGYWYNVTLGSLNEGMKTIKIKPTDVNMRYVNESVQEIIKSRYEQPNFWQKYGTLVLGLGFIAFIAIMSWFLFNSFQDAAGSAQRAAEVTQETAKLLQEAIGGIDALRASGGVAPAG